MSKEWGIVYGLESAQEGPSKMAIMERPETRPRLKINFFDRRRDPVWFEVWKLYTYCALWAVAILLAFSPFVAVAVGLTGVHGSPEQLALTILGRLTIIAGVAAFDYFVLLMPFEWYFHRYLFH